MSLLVRYVWAKFRLHQRLGDRVAREEVGHPLLGDKPLDDEEGANARPNVPGAHGEKDANGEKARLELDDHFSYTTDIGCQFIIVLFCFWMMFLKDTVVSKVEKCLVILFVSGYILTVQVGAVMLNNTKDDRKQEGDWAYIVSRALIVLTLMMTIAAWLTVWYSTPA